MSVPAARIRQHEDTALTQSLLLKSYRHRPLQLWKQGAIHRDADESDNLGLVSLHFAAQARPARRVLLGPQLVNSASGARDHIGNAVSPFRQAIVVQISHRLKDQTGPKEQLPESIRETSEVMTGDRGTYAGVNADEEYANSGPNPVTQAG